MFLVSVKRRRSFLGWISTSFINFVSEGRWWGCSTFSEPCRV